MGRKWRQDDAVLTGGGGGRGRGALGGPGALVAGRTEPDEARIAGLGVANAGPVALLVVQAAALVALDQLVTRRNVQTPAEIHPSAFIHFFVAKEKLFLMSEETLRVLTCRPHSVGPLSPVPGRRRR